MQYAAIIAAVLSAACSGVMSLISWSLKTEVNSLRTEMRATLAEAENRFFLRVNGNYVRKELYTEAVGRLERIESGCMLHGQRKGRS